VLTVTSVFLLPFFKRRNRRSGRPITVAKETLMFGFAIFLWLLFALGTGAYAASRGRNAIVWFVLALLISPLVCVVVIAVTPEVNATSADYSAPVSLSVATGSELLQRVSELFERGKLTEPDLVLLRSLAAREMPAPASPRNRSESEEFTRPCPSCGKLVHPKATTCMHCWAKLPRLAA
jgi:hypothetical protein